MAMKWDAAVLVVLVLVQIDKFKDQAPHLNRRL
jgi:hypothetical protein